MSGSRGPFEKAGGSAQFTFQFLGGQAVETGRADISRPRADRMGGVVVDQSLLAARGVLERQDRQFRVKGPGRPDRVLS